MGAIYDSRTMEKYRLDEPLVENGNFTVRFAVSGEDLREALALRQEVFRIERDCDSNNSDRDVFDSYALHILLINRQDGKVVGTYRSIPGEIAAEKGFYTAQEYDLSPLKQFAPEEVCEMGRSCVRRDFRSGAGIMMLWCGIFAMNVRFKFRYLLGCASLDETDPATGFAIYEQMRKNGNLLEEWQLVPQEKYRMERPAAGTVVSGDLRLPPLIKGYLRLGAKIAGQPALDRDFRCIDYPIWFDFSKIDSRYYKHFTAASEQN